MLWIKYLECLLADFKHCLNIIQKLGMALLIGPCSKSAMSVSVLLDVTIK